MDGLALIEVISLSGHLSNIDEKIYFKFGLHWNFSQFLLSKFNTIPRFY